MSGAAVKTGGPIPSTGYVSPATVHVGGLAHVDPATAPRAPRAQTQVNAGATYLRRTS